MSVFTFLLVFFLFIFDQSAQLLGGNYSNIERIECKTPSSTPNQILATKSLVENWISI